MVTTGSSFSTATPDAPASDAALDVVVGLPAPAAPGAVEQLTAVVRTSLEPWGSALRWRLVIATPASADAVHAPAAEANPAGNGVVEVRYAPQPSDTLTVPYHGWPARGRALHAILGEAHARQARVCVLLDPRAPVAGDTIERIVHPLVGDAVDFVAPVYARHPFSGAVVHGIVYPLFRAVYGARLRNPLGPDLGCSRRFIDAVVGDPAWHTEAGQLGIDLWLGATAASAGFLMGQARLGEPVEDRSTLDLGTIVAQVVGSCFSDMERRAASWLRIRASRAVPTFGPAQPPRRPPEVDTAALADSFRLASRELQDVWSEVLPPLAVLQWRRLAAMPADAFKVDDALWARTIYDFAMGHRLRVITRDHLLKSLTPLYLAWLASFVRETRQLPAEEAEARLERLCVAFETEKPYLVSQWRWPERFKPVKRR